MDYFREQKRRGRIRYLGFSTHGTVDIIRDFLDTCGYKMDFCQIQLNYLDWTLQDAKGKCALLEECGIPIWVMEPVRGGKLAKVPETFETKMKSARLDESIAAWAFRWLQTVPNPTVVLSGMSSMEQMVDNVKTYSDERLLSTEELIILENVAKELTSEIPCTACRYCCDVCPAGLDIPRILNLYNDLHIAHSMVVASRLKKLQHMLV